MEEARIQGLTESMKACTSLFSFPDWMVEFVATCISDGWPSLPHHPRDPQRGVDGKLGVQIPRSLYIAGEVLHRQYAPYLAFDEFWTVLWALGDIILHIAETKVTPTTQHLAAWDAAIKAQSEYWQMLMTKAQPCRQLPELEAVEQQIRTYRVWKTAFNARLQVFERSPGALHKTTVQALEVAEPYCWSQVPVEAAASAAGELPMDTEVVAEVLGSLGNPSATGWWWFERPLPIATTAQGEAQPTVALLWRRETGQDGRHRTWFSTFVMDVVKVDDHNESLPNPTLAWYWWDGDTVAQLEQKTLEKFTELQVNGLAGRETASVEGATAAVIWFSKFWLAGMTWLQQKLPMLVANRTPLPRQLRKSLIKKYSLSQPPLVQVIHLRKREQRPAMAAEGSRVVDWQWRWKVKHHWRKQWYAKSQKHARIYIEDFWKGPEDKPIKLTTRVYAVKR